MASIRFNTELFLQQIANLSQSVLRSRTFGNTDKVKPRDCMARFISNKCMPTEVLIIIINVSVISINLNGACLLMWRIHHNYDKKSCPVYFTRQWQCLPASGALLALVSNCALCFSATIESVAACWLDSQNLLETLVLSFSAWTSIMPDEVCWTIIAKLLSLSIEPLQGACCFYHIAQGDSDIVWQQVSNHDIVWLSWERFYGGHFGGSCCTILSTKGIYPTMIVLRL